MVADFFTSLANTAANDQKAEAVAEHTDSTAKWLRRLRPGVGKPSAKNMPNTYRKGVSQPIVALDNALWAATGMRLKEVVAEDAWAENRAMPHQWKFLMGVADKGPDGLAVVNFLK